MAIYCLKETGSRFLAAWNGWKTLAHESVTSHYWRKDTSVSIRAASYVEITENRTEWWLLAEMIFVKSGSHSTRSASEPTAMRPLRGYRLKILAAFVLVTATNWFSSILPVTWNQSEPRVRMTQNFYRTKDVRTSSITVSVQELFIPSSFTFHFFSPNEALPYQTLLDYTCCMHACILSPASLKMPRDL